MDELNKQASMLEEGEDYKKFTEKFKPKKTTDDCYTPPEIYDVVAGYVEERFELSRADFVRPFFPGGDYETYPYKATNVVVDNPPFSILTKICKDYQRHGIKFFLFAPSLTLFNSVNASGCTATVVGANVTYENGAVVSTSFLTNLEDGIVAKSEPRLARAIEEANTKRLKEIKKQQPKYDYPDHVLTSAMLTYMSKHGVDFELKKEDAVFIRALDSQKAAGKTLFGSGFLLAEKAAAEKAAAEKAAAEKAAAEVWTLSRREREIIRYLSRRTE